MNSFGKIDVFNPKVEEFSAYLERIELYFEANEISDERKFWYSSVIWEQKPTVFYER